jgi:hypothetical protein
MTQFDMFGGDPVETPPAMATIADVIAQQPEKLRPTCTPAQPRPTEAGAQLDVWIRETQRIYLLYLVGAIARITYRESSIANARGVLFKLNGMAGQW